MWVWSTSKDMSQILISKGYEISSEKQGFSKAKETSYFDNLILSIYLTSS